MVEEGGVGEVSHEAGDGERSDASGDGGEVFGFLEEGGGGVDISEGFALGRAGEADI